jgi:ribonuclease R
LKKGLISGKLSCHRDGYGFVIPESGGEDVFVPSRYLRDNMHGDRVTVALEKQRSHGKREGRIVETLERAVKHLVGRYHDGGPAGFVVPDEPRITCNISVAAKDRGRARDGEMVVVEITAYPSAGIDARGRVEEVLGMPDDPAVEVLAIVRKHGLPFEFTQEVLAEAVAAAKPVAANDLDGRVDLRDMRTVTIDGETARDFDDAVAVRREAEGSIRLWVSIADVSHYVPIGSYLDREALNRGTSVYFPDRCIPMLPEGLSNGICSLNPGEDRLTVTVEMLFDVSGNAGVNLFYPSVIRSDERMTYTEVKHLLTEEGPRSLPRFLRLLDDLETMEELARRLAAKRKRRGSIDFDLPEPEIILDIHGRPESIGIAERNIAHRIIEEFMLAANEAVACHLAGSRAPCIYRVHEPPDPGVLRDFKEFVGTFGIPFRLKGDTASAMELQHLLSRVEGLPEERMINELLLRCMKQARYGAENSGHFGLASKCYLHFTSPIRRYPDLVVHRILKHILTGQPLDALSYSSGTVTAEVAEQCSRRERAAVEAEREIVDLKRLQYMERHVGDVFEGYITGVAGFGFFVQLSELLVEGLVHVTSLGDDYYRLVEKEHAIIGERSGRRYRVGDRVAVKVAGVAKERKRIDFVPASAPGRGVGVSHAGKRKSAPRHPKGGGKTVQTPGKRNASSSKRRGKRLR